MSQPAHVSSVPRRESKLTSQTICTLAAILIAILPILLWPLLALFVIAGCAGNLHAGISCPPILGIRFHSLPTDLLQLSVKGLAVSLPVGLVGLGLCRSIAGKRSGKSH